MSLSNGTDITSPVGRIVWGNPLRAGQVRDNATGKPKLNEEGKPISEWSFGLAIPKDQCGEIFAAMNAEASQLYPQGIPPNFANKIDDGDGKDSNGKPYAEREGYAGHYVFSLSTRLSAPPVYQRDANGGLVQIAEGMKTGDYSRVFINIKAHGAKPGAAGSRPGFYLNPALVELVGYGKAIVRGPDPTAAFGAPVAVLPPGASATPIASGVPMAAPAAPAAPAMPMAPAAPAAPAAVPGAAPAAPAAVPGAAPAAHYGFLQGPQN